MRSAPGRSFSAGLDAVYLAWTLLIIIIPTLVVAYGTRSSPTATRFDVGYLIWSLVAVFRLIIWS